MKIRQVEVRQLSIPFDRPLITASFPISAIDTVLASVHTEDGVSGVSWVFAFGQKRVSVLKAMVEDLSTLVVGEDPRMTELLWQRMHRAVGFVGQQGVTAAAMSAIDTACWDLIGKIAGEPVYRLLGGNDSTVDVYASEGLWLDRTPEELAAEAASFVERGFRAVKMRVGKLDHMEDLQRVEIVRKAIGPDVELMLDANQAWTEKQTRRMAEMLAPFDIFWLEEPMPHFDVAGYSRVKSAIGLPLCTGESNYLTRDIRELIQADAADILMPDLMRMGGITGLVKAVHLCEAHNKLVTPHLFMEHSSHVAAASSNVIWQEHQPWWEPILVEPVDLRDGRIHLSDRPGFGIDIDWDAVPAFEVS